MADLAVSTGTVGKPILVTRMAFTLASGQVVYQGLSAAIDVSTGTVKNGTGGNRNLRIIGKFERDYDATGGAIQCLVQLARPITAKYYKNDTVAPVTAAYVGQLVYIKDNATVTLTATNNSVAGICWAVSTTDGVLVEGVAPVPTASSASLWTVDSATAAWTSNDFAPTGASLVNGTIYVLPTTGANSTVTLPSTGTPDGTVVRFFADGTTNGHTLTFRQVTTGLATATTASKRVIADCTCIANVWMVDVHVQP